MPEIQTYVVTQTRSVVVTGVNGPTEALQIATRAFELDEKVQMGDHYDVQYGYTTGLPRINSVNIDRD